jgi:hypothetical protein
MQYSASRTFVHANQCLSSNEATGGPTMQKNMRAAVPRTTSTDRLEPTSNSKKRARGGKTKPGAGLDLHEQALAEDEERRPAKQLSMSVEQRGRLRQQQKCPIRADGGKLVMKMPAAVDPPAGIRKKRSSAPSVSRSPTAAQEVCE